MSLSQRYINTLAIEGLTARIQELVRCKAELENQAIAESASTPIAKPAKPAKGNKSSPKPTSKPSKSTSSKSGKRTLSPEAREAISAAQRRRWAKTRPAESEPLVMDPSTFPEQEG